MVPGVSRKKCRFSSTKMDSTGCDSDKRHCSLRLCGGETVKFWCGFAARSGRFGRGEYCLLRWYCRTSTILIICMGTLAGWVQTNMIVSDGSAARTGAPFWWWMPLPMQNCNPGGALDKTYLHALLERRVMIPFHRCVGAFPPIDVICIINSDRRQFTCNDLWAPDPGRVPDIGLIHQLIASRGVMITGQFSEGGLWVPFLLPRNKCMRLTSAITSVTLWARDRCMSGGYGFLFQCNRVRDKCISGNVGSIRILRVPRWLPAHPWRTVLFSVKPAAIVPPPATIYHSLRIVPLRKRF